MVEEGGENIGARGSIVVDTPREAGGRNIHDNISPGVIAHHHHHIVGPETIILPLIIVEKPLKVGKGCIGASSSIEVTAIPRRYRIKEAGPVDKVVGIEVIEERLECIEGDSGGVEGEEDKSNIGVDVLKAK